MQDAKFDEGKEGGKGEEKTIFSLNIGEQILIDDAVILERISEADYRISLCNPGIVPTTARRDATPTIAIDTVTTTTTTTIDDNNNYDNGDDDLEEVEVLLAENGSSSNDDSSSSSNNN